MPTNRNESSTFVSVQIPLNLPLTVKTDKDQYQETEVVPSFTVEKC